MERKEIEKRICEFMESEARSCSMDFGCITPIYVYRMFGGYVELNEIELGLKQIMKRGLLIQNF